MKKLNEELAKLFGVEPKTYSNCRYCFGGGCFSCWYYPDFTKPDNFVKLWEIIIKSGFPAAPSWYQGTSEFIDYCNNVIGKKRVSKMVCGHSIQEFTINWAISCMELFDEMSTAELKQQAQQTDWSY